MEDNYDKISLRRLRDDPESSSHTMFLRTRSLISSLFSNSYTETARFTARVNTIYTLAISHDGQFLASGGK